MSMEKFEKEINIIFEKCIYREFSYCGFSNKINPSLDVCKECMKANKEITSEEKYIIFIDIVEDYIKLKKEIKRIKKLRSKSNKDIIREYKNRQKVKRNQKRVENRTRYVNHLKEEREKEIL